MIFPKVLKKGSSFGEKNKFFFVTLSGKQGGVRPECTKCYTFFNEGYPKNKLFIDQNASFFLSKMTMPIPNNSNQFKSLIKPLQGLAGASLTVPTWLLLKKALLKKALLAKVLLLSGGVAGGAAGATFGEAEADAKPEAEADPYYYGAYGHYYGGYGYEYARPYGGYYGRGYYWG